MCAVTAHTEKVSLKDLESEIFFSNFSQYVFPSTHFLFNFCSIRFLFNTVYSSSNTSELIQIVASIQWTQYSGFLNSDFFVAFLYSVFLYSSRILIVLSFLLQ